MNNVNFEEPPPGRLEFEMQFTPVSRQSRKPKRTEIKNQVQSITTQYEYLLSGDLHVEICWIVHEHERYETDRSPDIDNILKPLLDGLVGQDGLMIDDNQVQSVHMYWVDTTQHQQSLRFSIDFVHDDWIPKKNLIFVSFEKGLCFPFNTDMPWEYNVMILDALENRLSDIRKLEGLGVDYYVRKRIMPIQRFFHRSRVTKFQVLDSSEFRRLFNQT